MARIPTYQRQVAPEVAQAPRALNAETDLSGAAQGLQAVAGDVYRVQQKEIAEANQTALLNADNQLGAFQNKALYDPESGAFTKKGSGALNITQTTLGQYDQQSQGIVEGLANPEQKRMFQQAALQRRQELQAKLGSYEFGQQQEYKDDVDKSSIQLAQSSAALSYNDPQSIEQNRLKMNAVYESRAERLGWSPEEKEAQLQQANSSMSNAVIHRMVIDSPEKARDLYGQYKDSMTANDQIQATSTIDQAFKRQEAEARQRLVEQRQMQAISRVELQSRTQDATAAYSQGLDFKDPPNLADFKQAYGDKAGEHYAEFKKFQDIAPAIREQATATPEEAKANLEKFKPAQSGVAGEGFQQDSQLFQHLSSITSDLMRQRQKDPAGYVMKYSQTARSAYDDAQQAGTPEAFNNYANVAVAEQRRLGVQAPKLLPDDSADALAANINQKIASGGTENAAQMVESLQSAWGKNFSSIIQQVGNKLPEEVQVLATGLPKDIGERMASVAPLKDADLRAGLQKGQADEITQAVAGALQPFAESLQGQSGGISTYTTVSKAATRTAMSYVLQGMSPNDAADKVAKGIVNDKYDFFGTYRVPKTVDTQAVSLGARRALDDLPADQLAPLAGLRGVAPEENARQLHEAVQSGGQWITNNDETGLSLTLNGYRVMGKDGKPIMRTWSDLQRAGKAQGKQDDTIPTYGGF